MFEINIIEDGFAVVTNNNVQYELHIENDDVYEVIELESETRVDSATEKEIIDKYNSL